MNARPWLPAWLPEILVPVLQAGMAGCMAWSLAAFAQYFYPDWNLWWTVTVAVLAAFEAGFTFHLFKRRFVFMTDRWKMRLVEVIVVFIVVKIGGLVTQPLPPIADLLRVWTDDLLNILDLQTVVNFVIALSALLTTTETLDDLDKLSDPERSLATNTPRDRLYGRYFSGGFLLIVISGLTLVGLDFLFDFSRPPITGLILNALLYFLLGLGQIAVANYMYWAAIWDFEKVEVSARLGGRWTWHALALVAIAALVAFLLPTGYSDGVFGLARLLIAVAGFVIYLVYVAIAYVFAAVLSLIAMLFPNMPIDPTFTAPTPPPMPTPDFGQQAPVVPDPFWEQLRLILFGVTIVVMVGGILFLYLRDRPELIKLLRDMRWLRGLIRLFEALRKRGAGWARALRQGLTDGISRLRSRVPDVNPMRFWSLRRASPREQVLYYYLSTLRRAGDQGIRRDPAQTPNEYDPVLGTAVSEAEADVHALTDAFDHARYDSQPVDVEQANAVRAAWERLRSALRGKRRPPPSGAA